MKKQTLYYLVLDSVSKYAEKIAYWVRENGNEFKSITYQDWWRQSRSFSSYLLHTLKLQKGDRIGLICDNRYEWMLISMGITTIGGVDVPRGCDATSQDIAYILNHTECRTVVLEHEAIFQKVVTQLKELPHIKNIISIESRDRYKQLAEWETKLNGVRLLFLEDILTEGRELLQKREAELDQRGMEIDSTDLATIIYTSGTTGTPKGVMLEHGNFCWTVAQSQLVVPLNLKPERTLIFLPSWHIAERTLETLLIANGVTMACSSIPTLAKDMLRIRPTLLLSVPRIWEQLYRKIIDAARKQPAPLRGLFFGAVGLARFHAFNYDVILNQLPSTRKENEIFLLFRSIAAYLMFPISALLNLFAQLILKKVKDRFGGSLEFALSGASALPEKVNLFFRYMGIPIIEIYGMTETTACSTSGDYPRPKRGVLGSPVPGVQIQLRNEVNQPITEPGKPGILWHKGPHVMRGYYREREKTAEVLKDDWLNSGDILMYTTTGELKYTGRAKNTIVLANGENLEPEPIELALQTNEFINQVMVVGQDRKSIGALIIPSWESCRAEFQKQNISAPEDVGEWGKSKEIRKFFSTIIKLHISEKNGFKAFEKISGFYLLSREFEKGKEMTETLKVKRNVVLEIYSAEIKAIYNE